MNKKKAAGAAAALLLAAACAAGAAGTAGVYAYYTGTDRAVNRFTVGYNETVIEEPDFTEPPDVSPGEVYAKTVQIKNTGGADCYVRVKTVFSDDAAKELTEIDYNTTEWTYDAANGFYYYKKVLPKGETTVPLMTQVGFKQDAAQEEIDALGAFTVDVIAESCQSEGADGYAQAWERMEANRPSD